MEECEGRYRSYICLSCGKRHSVPWDEYQLRKKEPICDLCRNAQESEEKFDDASTEFVDSLDRVFSGFNSIVKGINEKKKQEEEKKKQAERKKKGKRSSSV